MLFVKQFIFFLLLGYYATVHEKFVYILVAATVAVNVFQSYLAIVSHFNVIFSMNPSNKKRKQIIIT